VWRGGGGSGTSVPSVFSKFSLKLGRNYGREIFSEDRCTYFFNVMDVAENKFSKRELALSLCWLENV
jgi:hypothetical protein